MSVVETESAYDTPLRRIRSTGDAPRRPDPIHRPEEGHPHGHSHLMQQPQSSSAQTPSETPQPLAVSTLPSRAPTQTLGEASRPNRPVAPPPLLLQRSWFARATMFFGIGRGASRERRTIVALYFTICSGFMQIIVISVILGLAGSRLDSPTKPGLTEWVACDRPLGTWACIWVIRAILACSLTYWGFLRERKVRQRLTEAPSSGASGTLSPHRTRNSLNDTPQDVEQGESSLRHARDLPYTRLYSRLTLLSSLLTLSWFLTAHILEYTSINTCRHSSPHIWWLTFSILCLMYLSVLEVIILSFIVFVIAPILFLFWNIILICMGRHPLQTGNMIRPEIGKLSKSVVDRIPLVIYIPPPPDGLSLVVPEPAHLYPPKSAGPAVSESRKRFRFIKMLSSSKNRQENSSPAKPGDAKDVEKGTEPQTWEEHWEKGEYPFVVLEGNRAACAICLMDFEEPKRLGRTTTPPNALSGVDSPRACGPNPMITVTLQDSGNELKLTDAGEGVQPLRLLECGHVFHKTCLDPWLIDVSGRCPVCQRAVIPELKKNKKER